MKQKLLNVTVIDLLETDAVDSDYLLQEIEKMAGRRAIDLVRENKKDFIANHQNKELNTRSLDIPNSLKLISVDEFERLTLGGKIIKEKDFVIQGLERDVNDYYKQAKALEE